MSKKLLIWLSIIAVLLVIIGWFTYWQWNNITAFVDALRYSNEEVESKLQENNQAIQQYLQKEENITVREMTEEEVQDLMNGTLTEEEVVRRLTGQEAPVEEPPETVSKPSESPTTTKAAGRKYRSYALRGWSVQLHKVLNSWSCLLSGFETF